MGFTRTGFSKLAKAFARLDAWWRRRFHYEPYHPELHYMRGPGPKTLARKRAQNTLGIK